MSDKQRGKVYVSKLYVSRTWLNHIRNNDFGGMQELIWISELNIAYYLRIEPYKMPDAFGGKVGYKVSFFSVCCRGVNFFGNISTMMHWLNYTFGIVSTP